MTGRWRRWTMAVAVGFVIAGLLVVGRESSLVRRSARHSTVPVCPINSAR